MATAKGKSLLKNLLPSANVPVLPPVVVGIGASAGGLDAFEKFFTNLPASSNSGLAFVLVQHLDPTHESILAGLIKRYTQLAVYTAADGVAVEPNCIYIIPPDKDLALLHGKLHLLEPTRPRGLRLPIDFFFRSLAQDQQERAICVVLAGTGTDGTLGLQAVKDAGGMVMVQDPVTAKFDGMLRSAIATGLADYILPPDKMAGQLLAYLQHPLALPVEKTTALPPPSNVEALQKIFILLRAQTGCDFSDYKQNTIGRRLERRMAMNRIGRLDQYVRYLQQNPLEVQLLFRELLIGVTSFFRDPAAYAAFAEQIIPRLFANKAPGATIRVWIPGCSTGEEAYSIAIVLQERLDELQEPYKIQIFATDIDDKAIDKARLGLYPASIVADLSAARLQRFFDPEVNRYRIKKSIREMVIFARQNLISDPPFSRLDFISCRNLLIYLRPPLQKKVIHLFHYALNRQGFLSLGSSETIGEFVDLFAVVNRKWKLYQRKGEPAARLAIFDFSPRPVRSKVPTGLSAQNHEGETTVNVRAVVEQTLLTAYSPASALVNDQGELLYIHGRTGKYLEPAAGEATLNILNMARDGLKVELTRALRRVKTQKAIIRRDGLAVRTNGDTTLVNLIVAPLTKPAAYAGLLLVIFEEATAVKYPEPLLEHAPSGDKALRIAQMEQELRAKDEHLQAMIEELESANEELRSTNEELQSTNEELQSTIEELETSREELQSTNEELMTVNLQQLKQMDELKRLNSDMNNLLAGTGIATIFVDQQLRIQRFTPPITQVVNLIESDSGRPLSHFAFNLDYADLLRDVKTVLATLIAQEVEVQSKEGGWYLMRILPYRTLENVVDGAVITFTQITQQKAVEHTLYELNQQLQDTSEYAQNIVESLREPLLVLNADLRIRSANRAFYETFQIQPPETEGRLIYDLGNQQWNIPRLRMLLEELLPTQTILHDFEVVHDFAGIGIHTLRLNAREIRQPTDKARLILLVITDITKQEPA